MSSDIQTLVGAVFNIVNWGIFLFGAFRATQIGRAMVSSVYRSRAFWTAALMLTFVAASFLDAYVPFFSTDQATIGLTLLSEVPSVIEVLLLLRFIDGTVLASIDTDFFHRDTLGWKRIRVPVYVVMSVTLVTSETIAGYIPTETSWAVVPGFGLILVILGYTVATLIVASRRTADRTMKRFVQLLGYALTSFVLALIVNLFAQNTFFLNLVDDVLFLAATYLLYRAVMTLSPLGRVENDPATSLKSGQTTGTSSEGRQA